MSTTTIRPGKILMLSVCLCFYFPAAAITLYQEIKSTLVCANDPAPVEKVITKFLKWYKINLHKANSFPILKKDSADNYMINKRAVTSYLDLLKSSKFISNKYITYWQTYFDDKAIELKEHPVQSDIPEGFDFDFVLITQEPELILNEIHLITFKRISITNTAAIIKLNWPGKKSMQYKFEMNKGKEGWQIEYISTPAFD